MKVFSSNVRSATGILLLLLLLFPSPAGAYSVLSHEEVVDMAWLPHIVPLLRARFPTLTDDEVRTAHAYAYGGSVIQDIGYYPFGSHEFSDILHYVRTGDFVSNLIRESNDANEYAFALGALAHYCGDVVGHPAVNQVTADEYPKLRRRFGRSVTYDQDKVAHLRTEFGFDVVQVAHGRYSQENYRDFIGFQVSKDLLERAFQETYGIRVDSIMKHEDLAISSYRRAVSSLIPKITTVALVSYKDQIEKENPGFDHKKFVYRLKRTEFEKQYGKQYAHPGIGSRVLAFFIRILPKIGPLKVFSLKIPNADEQDVYLKSINSTVDRLNLYLASVEAPTPTQTPTSQLQKAPDLPEIDLDTGKPSQFGEYHLADLSYASLLDTLMHDSKVPMTPDVYQSFIDFYSVRQEPAWYVKKPKDWKRLQANLALFDALPRPARVPASVAELAPTPLY
ncbi:zinc dependent phospholipase C family protein [Granulicella sp. dw_53]|uniref:zinc dependent phospholipase C family protein n=1 Tax=Granulicella sp. dw_53 TaxID=2719792 RepID=UPI001BD2A00A|nr:zinc dependent phospholipase C family protein [Granulicella sp. dw_53]